MKITFNDGQELQIQQVTEQTDGALLIKTISASEDQLKTLFSDQTTTKRMSVRKIRTCSQESKKAEEKNEMLEGCILEMSETVYQ